MFMIARINLITITFVFNLFHQGQTITYQTGRFDLLQNNGCAGPNTISFKTPFDNQPQVVAFFYYYDFLPNSGPLFIYSGITNTQFVMTFDCTVPGISSINIQWIAIEDDRFEFLSSFNNDVSNDLSKTFILPHSNPLHVQKFFGIMNFNYGLLPTFDFNLDVNNCIMKVQITTTDVTVTFTQSNLNVLSLGFYVVLGTADAFSFGQLITLSHVTYGNEGHYTNLPSQYNSQLVIVYQSMAYKLPTIIDTLRIRTFQQPNINQTISYFVASWYYCIVQSIKFQEIIIPTNNYIFQPTFFKKMRSSKKFDYNPDIYPVKLRIAEIPNKVMTKSQIFKLDSTHQWSTMIISIQCQISTYVKVQFLKCFGCADMFQNFEQQCYASINLMEFYVTLYQQDQVEQKFQVDITSTTIKVTHLVQNIIGDVPYETIILSLEEV